TFREAACAQPAALGSPAIQSICVHLLEPSHPQQLCKPTRILAVRLRCHRRQCRLHMPRLQQNGHCDNGPASSPIRFTGTPSSFKKQTRASGSLATFASFTILPRPSTTQTLESSKETSIPT